MLKTTSGAPFLRYIQYAEPSDTLLPVVFGPGTELDVVPAVVQMYRFPLAKMYCDFLTTRLVCHPCATTKSAITVELSL